MGSKLEVNLQWILFLFILVHIWSKVNHIYSTHKILYTHMQNWSKVVYLLWYIRYSEYEVNSYNSNRFTTAVNIVKDLSCLINCNFDNIYTWIRGSSLEDLVYTESNEPLWCPQVPQLEHDFELWPIHLLNFNFP